MSMRECLSSPNAMRSTHKSDETVRVEDKVMFPRPVVPYERVHASRLQTAPDKGLAGCESDSMQRASTLRRETREA